MSTRAIRVPASLSFTVTLCAAVLLAPSVAFGWDCFRTHPALASRVFSLPEVSSLANEFLTSSQISAITGFQGDLFTPYHGHWDDVFVARAQASPSFWSELDETTRLQYLVHNACDCGVPVGHAPACQAPSSHTDGTAESRLETQIGTWASGDYPYVTGNSYAGTYAEVVQAFKNDVQTNATNFKNSPKEYDPIFGFYLGHTTDANRHYGNLGMIYAEKFCRAFLVDYFLLKRNTKAVIDGSYGVNPGGAVTFSSAGSQDPDSITWNSNGTYVNNGGGLASIQWDLNNDGTYETSGANPYKSYSDLLSLVGPTEGRTINLRVTDDEGKVGATTSTLAVYTPPVANANGGYGVNPGGSISFSSSGSHDPDGGSLTSYGWDLNNDGTYETSGSGPTLNYSSLYNLVGPTEGKTLNLRVVDNEGVSATAVSTVAVYTPPVAAGKAQYGWLGKPGDVPSEWDWDNLIDNGSNDPDGGSITTWAWDLNNDGTFDKSGGSSTRVYYSDFSAVGVTANENQKVTLRVTDNEGKTTTISGISMPVLVNPVANAFYEEARAWQNGDSAQLSGDGYDPDGGPITQYRWDVNNDGTWDIFTASASPSYNDLLGYGLTPSQAELTVRFGVVDNDANITGWWAGEATDTTMLYLYSLPTVTAEDRYAVEPGSSILFSASGYDPDGGSIAQWLWDLDGDGEYGEDDDLSGLSSLTYAQLLAMGLDVGEWLTIGLKVVDNEGQTAFDTAELALYPSILGDANCDGYVDDDDLSLFLTHWNAGGAIWGDGNFNMDSLVDDDDLSLLLTHWNQGTPPTGFPIPTPEPMTLSLLGVGALTLLRQRKESRKPDIGRPMDRKPEIEHEWVEKVHVV